MKLHKVDTTAWTVREVEGEPWPGLDSDGDKCFDNTHFATAEEAWERLERNASAWVEMAGRAVTDARAKLREYEVNAANAAVAYEKVLRERRQSFLTPVTEGALPPVRKVLTSEHRCHWPGCNKAVSPAMWGCDGHLFTLPAGLRARIRATYQPDQDVNGTHSAAYIEADNAVKAWIADRNATQSGPHR